MTDPVALETDEPIAALLSRALKLEPFFPEFSAEHARKLFPRSGLFAYPRERVLVRQGDLGRDLFIVCAGRVGVIKGAGFVVATLEAGAVLGEIALLREVPRTATVTALEDSRVFRLAYPDLRYILEHNEQLAAHLRTLATQRLAS